MVRQSLLRLDQLHLFYHLTGVKLSRYSLVKAQRTSKGRQEKVMSTFSLRPLFSMICPMSNNL